MEVEWKNPRFTRDGLITCEVLHPRHGWIPFTVNPEDEAAPLDTKALDAEIREAGGIAPYEPPAVTPEQIKAEAYRRIVAVCPEWKQRNLMAQAALLLNKGRENWTTEDQAAWDAGEAIWQEIAKLRAASDRLEAMDPIPQDYATNGSYWA